jgi:hypothetical protein
MRNATASSVSMKTENLEIKILFVKASLVSGENELRNAQIPLRTAVDT